MILALRALGVGDLATAVPAIRGLRNTFPGETLALAAPAWLIPLIDLVGGVDRIVPTDGLGGDSLPIGAPEIAVNLHGRGPQSHRLLQATKPVRFWAFANAAARHEDGPQWIENEHEVHRWCRLLRHYGVAAAESDLSLAVPEAAAPDGATIIHPGAKSPSRRWPPACYATVAKTLHAAGHRVVITGSAAEHDLAIRVATEAGLPADAVPATTLSELARLVARARVLISGDTGIAHLATAYATPSVLLFGPMSPARWGPPSDRAQHRVIWHGIRDEPGDSPHPGVHPALLSVSPADVVAEVDQVDALRRP